MDQKGDITHPRTHSDKRAQAVSQKVCLVESRYRLTVTVRTANAVESFGNSRRSAFISSSRPI